MENNYINIIRKAKFIAKPNTWFVEGSEAKLDPDVIYPSYTINDKFNSVCGLFDGITNETYKGYTGELPREDSETCEFSEFFIYDENGVDITELTLTEYNNLYGK